jgi:diacylglycerol kinase (ATP)
MQRLSRREHAQLEPAPQPSPANATVRKALIVYNPISSGGNALQLAERFNDVLTRHGIDARAQESERKMTRYRRIAEEISASDLLVVIGGDGTVRKLLRILSRAGTPLYVVPGGNESLIAKSLGTSPDPNDLLAALNGGRYLDQYYGLISGDTIKGKKPFFVMASMGLDSLTVKRIGKRKGPLNDFVYAWHAVIGLWSLHHPTITLTVDGERVVERQQGYMIVANSPAYAKDLAIVPKADPAVETLTAGFLAGASRYHELVKGLRIVQRRPARLPLRYFSGKEIELELHHPTYPLQVDGDWFRDRDMIAGSKTVFSTSPRPIRLLVNSR